MAVTKLVGGIKHGSAVCALANGTIVVASVGGKITRYDATGMELESMSVGAAVGALAAHPAGDGVLATSKDALQEVRFGAAPSVTKLRSIAGARGLAVDAATGTVLVTSSTSGRLLRVFLTSPKKPTVVASALVSPVAVAMRAGASHAYVLSRAGVATVFDVDLAGGTATLLITSVGVARDMSWINVAGTHLAAGDGGSIVLADIANPAASPVVLESGLKPVWGLDYIAGSNVLVVGSGTSLLLVDLPAPPAVSLEMPTDAMYLSSWARIGVATNGVAFDDLVFRVEPPEGGLVSHSKDATFDKRPSVVLAASAIVGAYQVIAHDRSTGDKLAVGEFKVTDVWTGVDGPSASYVGMVGADSPDPAWGGGDPFVPQNLSVTPVLGNRRVAVALAETTDITALSNADQAALRTAWQNEVFDGVMRGGVLESARRYWRDGVGRPDGPRQRRRGRPDPARQTTGRPTAPASTLPLGRPTAGRASPAPSSPTSERRTKRRRRLASHRWST